MAADLTGAVFLSRTREKRDFVIPSQPEVTVGYDRSNGVAVPFEGVSRRHARISFDGKEYWIEDVGSANGTYLNAVRLTERERLKHLDVVTLGRRADLIFMRRSVDVQRKVKIGIVSARLEVLDGLDAGTRREIPRGTVTIGRSAGNNIVADSQLVSKVHARLERSGVELVLTDLQSANGTFVNEERIDSRILKDGDEIRVGRARSYRVRIEEGEVLTGDVSVAAQTSTTSNPSLPMDWRTHLEWSPEEAAEFDKARAKLRQSRPGAAAPPPAKGSTSPAPKVAEAKPVKPATPPAEAKAAAKPVPATAKPEAVKPAPPAPEPAPVPAVAAAKPEPPPPAAAAPQAAPPVTPPAEERKPPQRAAAAPPTPPAPKPSEPVPPRATPPAAAGEPAQSPDSISTPAAPPQSPVRAPEAARGATRALSPEQLPKLFLESPARTFPLALGTFEIGRDPAADVCLKSSEISRHHARLKVTEHEAVLEDLKTINGTFVNQQRLHAPRPLAEGDEVMFGSMKFRVRFGAGYPQKS